MGGQGRPPLQDVLRFRRTLCNFAIACRRVDVGIDPYGISGDAPSAAGHKLLHDLDRQQDEDDDDGGFYDL